MWGLLTPLLFAILIVWLMSRWVRLPEYAQSAREWLAARRAAEPVRRPAQPQATPEELALRERYRIRREQVMALGEAEARARAEEALRDGRVWRCAPARTAEYAHSGLLGPSLRAFLAEWDRIEDAFGGVRIRRDELALYRWPDLAGLSFSTAPAADEDRSVCIGTDRDGDPLVVRQGQERVTVVHGGRTGSREVWFSEFPSVFHFLLLQHSEVEAAENGGAADRAGRRFGEMQ